MEKLSIIRSTYVPLPIDNVDTDQIIPARFLKATSRKGFGDNLFRDWRYDKENKPIPDFVLNCPQVGGTILVAGKNFGSGSSREHAAWAVYDYGFRAVLAPAFADIFRNNALNNGLLPIVVSQSFTDKLFVLAEQNTQAELEVHLPEQYVKIIETGEKEFFEISGYKKHCLMNGLDDIDYLCSIKDDIRQFEQKGI